MNPLQQSPSKQFRQTTLANFYQNNPSQLRVPYDPTRASQQPQPFIQATQEYPRSTIPNYQATQQLPVVQSLFELDNYKMQNPLSRIMQGAKAFIPPNNAQHAQDSDQRATKSFNEQYNALRNNKKETHSILSALVSKKWPIEIKQDDEDDDIVEIEQPNEMNKNQTHFTLDDIEEENDGLLNGESKIQINENHANATLLMQKTSRQSLQRQLFAPKIDQGANNGIPQNAQRTIQDSFNFLPNNNQQTKSSQDILDEIKLKQFREKSAADRIQQEKLKLVDDDMIKIQLNNNISNRFQVDPAEIKAKRQQRLDDMLFSDKKELGQNSTLNNNNHITSSSTISSLVSQSQKIKAIFSNIQKNNPSALQQQQANQNKEKLQAEKQEKEQKEDANEGDDGGLDAGGEDEGKRKKQRINEQDFASVKYYYDKIGEKQEKQKKIKTKEEVKRAKIILDLQQQEQAKELQKRQEERKAQRQKFIYLKEMEEQRKKENEQTSVEYRKKMKETFKKMNLEEKLNEQMTEVEDGEKIAKLRSRDGIQFPFEDDDSEEDKKNFFSLIHFIFSQDYNNPEIVRVENKKIPNKFNGWKEYFSIFEYLFLMECVSNIQQIYTSFQYHENYAQPLQCYVSLVSTKENSQGFFEFQVFRNQDKSNADSTMESGEIKNSSGCEEDYYTLSTLHNHAVLISNCSEPELSSELSHKHFSSRKNFLFFGWVVPPDHNDSKSVLKIYSDIDAVGFKEAFQPGLGEQRLYVNIFKFQKMTTFLREYLSIKNMRYNGLNNFIYNPAHIVETKTPVSNPQIFIPLFEELKQRYNSSQFQSIKEICLTDKGICMLQGPPGTGKTHTLLGLLSGLYFYIKSNPETTKPKIMICAPSNTAVDEIVSRIIDAGLQLPGERVSVNVIRIGAIDYVPSENVKQACLEYQIEKMMITKGITSNDKIQKEMLIDLQIGMVKLNQEIEKTKKELSGQELRNQLSYLYERKHVLQQKISQQKLEKVSRRDQIKAISEQILGLADVICCTLASSISEKLERFKNQIEVLIVDEAAQVTTTKIQQLRERADVCMCVYQYCTMDLPWLNWFFACQTQCTEPNNIIPLFYEPNKMILIGDPKQLPATTFQPDSNVTKYNRSLFERIIDNNIQPYFLDQQYRMHPNIREFPSSQFYDKKLKDGELVLNRQFPDYLQRLENRNVQFIDIVFSREKANNKSYENECEGEAAINICLQLINEIEITRQQNPLKQEIPSIGIITPYKQQTKMINQMLRKLIPKNFHKHIQVNTVDSFQGQEKDIIIFTTVRVNTSANFRENMIGFLQDERRMNVAITRARFCLIVLGHADTLNSNPVWGAFVDYMAKIRSYGKLMKKEELREIGELVLQGQLLVGSNSEYIKKDWGEQYRSALLKSKQVNELKLTDFEFPQNQSELNAESEELLKEKQFEIEPEFTGIQDTEEQQQQYDAFGARNEVDYALDTDKYRTAEKKKGGNDGISPDRSSDRRFLLSEISSHKINLQTETSDDSQEDVQIVEEWDNSESKRKRNRTGVTMKEAIENHEEEMMMKKKITGLSALVSSKSPKKPCFQQQLSREIDQQLKQQPKNVQVKEQELNNNLTTEGYENSNNNFYSQNDGDPQKNVIKKLIFGRENAEEEKQTKVIEAERKEPSKNQDIYAQMRAQKIQSLKMKKQQEEKQKGSDEKDHTKGKAVEHQSDQGLKKKVEPHLKRPEEFQGKRKYHGSDEKKKKEGSEDNEKAVEPQKASSAGKAQKANQYMRESSELISQPTLPPSNLNSIAKQQKQDSSQKGGSSLSSLLFNSSYGQNPKISSILPSTDEADKERTTNTAVAPASSQLGGSVYDKIQNCRDNTSVRQQNNSGSKNLSTTPAKPSTKQLLNTIYSKRN